VITHVSDPLSFARYEDATDYVRSVSFLRFNLKIERVVSKDNCNASLVRMCCCCRKYRVAVRRSRVAVGGQPCLGDDAEMDPHLVAGS
jgi:hypothetical protein